MACWCSLLAVDTLFAQHGGGFAEFEMDQLGIHRTTPTPNVMATDSLYVEVWSGQKYLSHKIRAGQTLYSIKKFYAVDISDLYYCNPILELF